MPDHPLQSTGAAESANGSCARSIPSLNLRNPQRQRSKRLRTLCIFGGMSGDSQGIVDPPGAKDRRYQLRLGRVTRLHRRTQRNGDHPSTDSESECECFILFGDLAESAERKTKRRIEPAIEWYLPAHAACCYSNRQKTMHSLTGPTTRPNPTTSFTGEVW